MLKIKDGVDLKKLAEKYDFTIEYDKNTGKIKELYRINGHYHGDRKTDEKRRRTTLIRREDFDLTSTKRRTMLSIFKKSRIIKAGFLLYGDKEDLDVIFDLITDGLVEKVDDNE